MRWRFGGKSPFEGHFKRPPREGEPVWPSRQEALLMAFEIEAGLRERDTLTLQKGVFAALGARTKK